MPQFSCWILSILNGRDEMQYEKLVGNEGLKARLRAQTARRGLSHGYLITGPRGSGKHTLAQVLTKAFLCDAKGDRPCGMCQNCRKVSLGIHPDVRQVTSPAVGEVRQLRKDAYIRPNEGGRKVYLIDEMQTVNSSAQNALLKVLEEGPDYAAFLLLTEAEEYVLETVRSRCEILRLSPVPQQEVFLWLTQTFPDAKPEVLRGAAQSCEGILGRAVAQVQAAQQEESPAFALADRFFDALMHKEPVNLMECAVSLESLARADWSVFLQALEMRFQTCLPKAVAADRTEQARLLSYFEIIRTIQTYVDANVGTGHCAGLLYVLCAEAIEKGAT